MTTLPKRRDQIPVLKGLKLLSRGKVRDTYDLGSGLLLCVATDAISIFDFVLDDLVPDKGMVLTAMTHFWAKKLEENDVCKTHIVAFGSAVDGYIPKQFRNNINLQCRAFVVKQLKMAPVEFIARGYLTGSALKEYEETGSVFGVNLPAGLQDGDALPFVLDTPTTKESEGHDVPMDRDSVRLQYYEETDALLRVYDFVSGFAKDRGIIFADTKLEFGRDYSGDLVLGDEIATPDSSRFWGEHQWRMSRIMEKRKAPLPYDKQLVRSWGALVGINKRDPLILKDTKKVHSFSVPRELISATSETYRYIFWLLTGRRIENYVASRMNIPLDVPKRKVAMVFGSESDVSGVSSELAIAEKYWHSHFLDRFDVHVLNCLHNPLELVNFAESGCGGADMVIAAGGKSFALPGILDANLYAHNKRVPVIGVALGTPGTDDFLAAQLSISKLPGQPVVMDEKHGVYSGGEGLSQAIARATFGEVPPIFPREKKEAKFVFNYSGKL